MLYAFHVLRKEQSNWKINLQETTFGDKGQALKVNHSTAEKYAIQRKKNDT